MVYERLLDLFALCFWCLVGWLFGHPDVPGLARGFWLITSTSSNARMPCLVKAARALEDDMAETEPLPSPEQRMITRLIRLKEVQHRVGLGRSTIYRWMAEGKFPKPVQLGGYAVAWAEDDIQLWISARLG